MAAIVRYFSTVSAGSGDGTDWNNRAALFDGSNNWSTIIREWDFLGSDSLECRVGPGSYTCGQVFQNSMFTVAAPVAANAPLIRGCDGTGNPLMFSMWTSAQPATWESDLPVIAANFTNTAMCVAGATWLGIKFTQSIAGAPVTGGRLFRCVIVNTINNSSGQGCATALVDSVVRMSGTSWDAAIVRSNANTVLTSNVRIEGNVSASSGNRRGLVLTANTAEADRITVINCPGFGAGAGTQNDTGANLRIQSAMIVNCGVGIQGNPTVSQTSIWGLTNIYVANSGTYGVDASNSNLCITGRVRSNTSGDFNNMGKWTTVLCDTSAGTDTDEFVDATNGDYRIRYGSTYWGKGIGAGDGPATIAY